MGCYLAKSRSGWFDWRGIRGRMITQHTKSKQSFNFNTQNWLKNQSLNGTQIKHFLNRWLSLLFLKSKVMNKGIYYAKSFQSYSMIISILYENPIVKKFDKKSIEKQSKNYLNQKKSKQTWTIIIHNYNIWKSLINIQIRTIFLFLLKFWLIFALIG